MRISASPRKAAFTLSELMMATALGSIIIGATVVAAVSLQKSFAAVDNYFSAYNQQNRVIDYLGRDVNRAVIVNTSVNNQTVNCTLPNYVIQAGEPDAAVGIGTRRTPTVDFRQNAFVVNYGPGRTITDGVTTNNSATLTSATAGFTAGDVGSHVSGAGIPVGAKILIYTNSSSVILSSSASASGSNVKITIGGARTFADAVMTSGSATITSANAVFTQRDVGSNIAGNGIPVGSTIQSYIDANTITLSSPVTVSGTAVTATIGYSTVIYSVNSQTIVRTENGNITTIASSTDQLVPTTTDVQTANTEYTATAVTFKPTFIFSGASTTATANMERAGTTLYSTAYLRNLRRGN